MGPNNYYTLELPNRIRMVSLTHSMKIFIFL